jgi:hypothetical protein
MVILKKSEEKKKKDLHCLVDWAAPLTETMEESLYNWRSSMFPLLHALALRQLFVLKQTFTLSKTEDYIILKFVLCL